MGQKEKDKEGKQEKKEQGRKGRSRKRNICLLMFPILLLLVLHLLS